jgi:CBS domain-containing protein
MTVGEFCNRQVVIARRDETLVTAREDENLLDALKKMRSFGVRRLPIVNETGGLEGILTFDDLIDLVAGLPEEEAPEEAPAHRRPATMRFSTAVNQRRIG